MDNENFISLEQLCMRYEVKLEFVESLNDFGLLHIIREGDEPYIAREELSEMERMIHLHYELDINLAGIEAIHHLLERVKEMQKELNQLRNRLDSF